jgi:alkylhydroperoxidase family enzyme
MAAFFHLFVIGYEEPAPACRFGVTYLEHQRTVPRWIPRPPGRGRQPASQRRQSLTQARRSLRMAMEDPTNERSHAGAHPVAGPYLAPIEKPKGLMLRLLYRLMRRQFGKTPTWLKVFGARMPLAFLSWGGKPYRLENKLKLSRDTGTLVRARVSGINMCTWCMDAERWSVMTQMPHLLPKLDAISDYRTSPVFSDKERAALEFATELTELRHVSPPAFETLSRHYSEREICEIVWVVATENLSNISNLGLGIGSDGLCEVSGSRQSA